LKISNYISNHPFFFLINIVLVASFCSGGFLLISGMGRPAPLQATTTISPAATVQNMGDAGSTPSNAPTNEIKPTALPEPSATVTEIPIPEPTATSAPVALAATVTLAPVNPGAPLVVTYLDVGQGDSILIQAPDGQTALIDGGSAGSGALAYLQNQGIQSIDILIATHPHEDHIGGLVEVLEAMPVKKVITNGQTDTTTIYKQFLDAIAKANAEYVEVRRGDTIALGSLAFSVLNPATVNADNLITNSLVLRMSYGATEFLFMGDADMEAEAGILAAGLPVQADILKLGHHGSCESSSPAFLDVVQPLVAMYSAGSGNPFGYPCAGTISVLNARGIFVFGTDIYGSVIVTVTLDGYAISNATGLIFRR
jgi:competence protein ComEC